MYSKFPQPRHQAMKRYRPMAIYSLTIQCRCISWLSYRYVKFNPVTRLIHVHQRVETIRALSDRAEIRSTYGRKRSNTFSTLSPYLARKASGFPCSMN
jgi:hypothetical protein